MTGIEIEYLLGIFFIVESLGVPMGTNQIIKFAAGAILLILAVVHKSLI